MAYKLVIVRVLAISVVTIIFLSWHIALSSAMELPKLKSVLSKYSSYTVNISHVEVVVVSFYLRGNHTLWWHLKVHDFLSVKRCYVVAESGGACELIEKWLNILYFYTYQSSVYKVSAYRKNTWNQTKDQVNFMIQNCIYMYLGEGGTGEASSPHPKFCEW